MLARAGWTARVHERAAGIRESGAGIYMRRNSLRILDEFGILDDLKGRGSRILKTRVLDAQGKVHQERDTSGELDLWVFPRQALIEALEHGARSAGVDIQLGSLAVSADPAGALVLEDGTRIDADLVVAADGGRSRVRDSVISGARFRELPTSVNRHFIDGREISRQPVTSQHWSGKRRVGIAPCGLGHTYVFTVCPDTDSLGRKLPFDVEEWARSFPKLRHELEVIASTPVVTQYHYPVVSCPTWHNGRVAIIGDAATALPPTLGQGAGLAIMNARALALALDRQTTVEKALAYWEHEVRFISDATQLWSCRYDWFSRAWPSSLSFIRPSVFHAVNRITRFDKRMLLADEGLDQTALKPMATTEQGRSREHPHAHPAG